MSSSRNKRKRADVEVPAAMASPTARRRSGAEPSDPEGEEGAASASAPATVTTAKTTATKNEGNNGVAMAAVASTGNNSGESSSSPPVGTTNQPQHKQVAPVVQSTATAVPAASVSGSTTIQAKPPEEKKQETNADMTKRAPSPKPSTSAQSTGALPATSSAGTTPSVQATQDGKKGVGGKPINSTLSARGNKLKSLISHRKLLLDRVRSGRSAARGRVVDMARNEAQAAKQQAAVGIGDSARGNSALPAKPAPLSEKARDEAEVAAFKKLSKSALQTAKKQRGDDGGQEKRSSVSLRRGASVGKKMNAALSTLAPERSGSAATAVASATAGAAPAQPLHVASAPAAGEKATVNVANQQTPLPVQRQPSSAVLKHPTHQYASQPTGKKLKGNQNQALKGGLPSVSEAIPKIARSGSQKAIKAGTGGIRGTSSSAGASIPGQPLHAGMSAAGLPTNRLAQQRAPVVCQEAVALREKRKAIQSKLTSLLQKRYKPADSRGPDPFAASTTVGTTHSSAAENAKKKALSILATKKHPEPSSYLPRRRKTHWDNLLQEMKWMATDFSEERKWKVSAARTLGSAVQSTGKAIVKTKTIQDTSNCQAAASADGNNPDGKLSDASVSPKLATSETILPKKAATRKGQGNVYLKPTTDDTANVKKVARIVSSMAHEVGVASLRAGALAQSDRLHLKSLERHLAKCQQIRAEDGDVSIQPLEGSVAKRSDAATTNGASEASAEQGANDKKSQVGSFKRISKAVDNLLESFSSSPRRPPKRKSTSGGKGDGDEVALTSIQLEIIEFVEKKWGQSKNGAGAILTGSRASGKTTAICSLLWKQRSNGAQLLVCSPFRVMKWMHELKSFKSLEVKLAGMAAGISSTLPDPTAMEPLGANQIVVCELSSLPSLKKEDLERFETIVLDCRYPQGFLGSRWPSSFDGNVVECQPPRAMVPPELISESWWEGLVEKVAKSSLNCMILENPGELLFLAKSIDRTEMQRVELISLRAAFVLGARLFASPNSSVKKRILTWARRRTKETAKTTTSNKVKEVQEFFLALMRPFHFDANCKNYLELVSHEGGKRLDLEIRPCSFSDMERAEYDKCCHALRGALSFKINKAGESNKIRGGNHRSISNALLCLRRRCFHAQMLSLLQSTQMRSRLGAPSYPNGDDNTCASIADHRILSRKVNDSASQTDFDLAAKILEGSAKLRELLSILRNECEYRIEDQGAIGPFLNEPDKPRRAKQNSDQKSAKMPKKVVILAVLPEVQIILSVLLNCIGLAHELLLRPSRFFCPSDNEIVVGLPEKQRNASTLAWLECQQALSRFNSALPQKCGEPLNLLIASPDIVAGDHGGIGIDLADFVISVDEDWSGRNELIMRSLVAGLIPRNLRAKDKGCQILKLVCQSTCEENFLAAALEGAKFSFQPKEHTPMWPWPVDMFGRFVTSDPSGNESSTFWPERKHKDAMFSFPALNLFHFRNQTLSEVLGAEGLPPLLDLGSPILFLPEDIVPNGGNDLRQRSAEINLLKHLMDGEDSAHKAFEKWSASSTSASLFHGNATTRQDMQALATRLYLEHFQKSRQVDSGSEQGMPKIMLAGGHSTEPTNLVSGDNTDAAVSLQGSGSGSGSGPAIDPLGLASSLLLYNPLAEPDQAVEVSGRQSIRADHEATRETSTISAAEASSSPRTNTYARAYQFNHNHYLHDGKQGSESLVYFPPLFPRLLQCTVQAKRDLAALRAKTPRKTNQLKRSGSSLEDSSAKRTKLDNSIMPMGIMDGANSSFFHSSASPAAITEDEASHEDAATVLLDLDEDFGLAGVGAIPLPKDAVLDSATTTVEVSTHALDPDRNLLQNEWFEGHPPCDAEELDTLRMSRLNSVSLNGVILFTGRKKRPYSSRFGTSAGHRQLPMASDMGWTNAHAGVPVLGPDNGVFHHEINGAHNSAKKNKKKAATPAASAQYTRPAAEGGQSASGMTQLPINAQMARTKEMYRSRIVAFLSTRQKALGVTLFESPAYCFAAVRFRDLFNERVPRMNWAQLSSQKLGPGLPMVPESQPGFGDYGSESTAWTSIVKRLKTEGSKTGDDARALAEVQRSSLRRSLSAPSRVDFGPFQCGFLLSLSGMTGISPPRSRSGVSLPMGVKVQVAREQQPSWSEIEDEKLRGCTGRFGMNWMLASRRLSGLDDVAKKSDEPAHHRRSARNCRDRWQALARGDSSLAKEVQASERMLRVNSNMRVTAVGEDMDESIRLGKPIDASGFPETDRGTDTVIPFLVDAVLKDDHEPDISSKPGEAEKPLEPEKSTEPQPEPEPLDDHTKILMDEDNHKLMDLDDHDAMELEDMLAGAGGEHLDAMDLGPLDLESMDIQEPIQEPKPIDIPEEPKKAFKFLVSAKAKKQEVPMTIPGVVPGSQPSFVASHPSHQQSVQSSIAATWTNGRTEMWPLQFLDISDKQRNAKAAAAAAETQVSPKHKSTSSSSSRSPTAGRSPQSTTGAPPAARTASSSSSRAPPVSGSSGRRPPPGSSSGRTSTVAASSRAQAVHSSSRTSSTGRAPAVATTGRPQAAASGSRAASAAAGSPRAHSSMPRPPASANAARAPAAAAARAHPSASSSTNHSRSQAPGVPYGSPVMKYPPRPHPQSGGHYPMPHPHPSAHPSAHPGPHSHHPHHPHQHHQQRMVPSPANRTGRGNTAPPQPKYAAPAAIAHSQTSGSTVQGKPPPVATPAPAPTARAQHAAAPTTTSVPAVAPVPAPIAAPALTPAPAPAPSPRTSTSPAAATATSRTPSKTAAKLPQQQPQLQQPSPQQQQQPKPKT